jgi:tetratricopeptide (TPR) repeat protein
VVEAYLRRAQANSRLGRFAPARADYQAALKRAPANAGARNALAWLLATCPDAKARDPVRAVESARKAVQLAPTAGDYRRTLGVAHYRAGDWKAAVFATLLARAPRWKGTLGQTRLGPIAKALRQVELLRNARQKTLCHLCGSYNTV